MVESRFLIGSGDSVTWLMVRSSFLIGWEDHVTEKEEDVLDRRTQRDYPKLRFISKTARMTGFLIRPKNQTPT